MSYMEKIMMDTYDLLENDEISPEEAAFMIGYLDE